ncbi:MAG: acyl-CoA dehydrogenase family protein [Acidobacteriota bacterium]
MNLDLTPEQRAARERFRAFANERIVPFADAWDRQEAIPRELIAALAAQGWLGSLLPPEVGGAGLDRITYGLLIEEIGRACSSTRSLLTVHDMVGHAVRRWGKPEVKERHLSALAKGERIGALALSEPNVGSDAASIETRAVEDGEGFVLFGRKKWTTFGQIADLFLVFAKVAGQPAAFLVERNAPGLSVVPIHGMHGTRAAMLAELHLDGCRVPRAAMLGRPGFGISHVAATALELGRYSVAWGSVGILQACLEASQKYAAERVQFGASLIEHPLIRSMLAEMIANVRAGRLLCLRAGFLQERSDPAAFAETMLAKYFCSVAAAKAASDAVQIQGANGCAPDSPVARYLRDSKVMEIIEGSTQIQQLAIPRFDFPEL